jgi:cellulose synthase/poly-beta-1,6-N-acetylglucosamine synthase-like glycosyltransferase
VSIIIPCRTIDEVTKNCVSKCHSLDYPNIEIVLLPDERGFTDGALVFPTGPVSPGKKRNVGASAAKGEVFAYIDADAYPRTDWLSNAMRYLQRDNVGAVGGPGLTPPDDSSFAQAQGAILSSFLVSGKISTRYKSSQAEETDDIHSVNFVAWRKVVERVGGWNEQYWPGEDTLICREIKKAGYKQLLAPDVVVYHKRRTTWGGYLTQIRNYGIHRGFFAKHFPENSLRLGYFFPSFLIIGLVGGILLSLVFPLFWYVLATCVVLYILVLLAVAISDIKNISRILLGIPLTHLAYGTGFLQGLVIRRLSR